MRYDDEYNERINYFIFMVCGLWLDNKYGMITITLHILLIYYHYYHTHSFGFDYYYPFTQQNNDCICVKQWLYIIAIFMMD